MPRIAWFLAANRVFAQDQPLFCRDHYVRPVARSVLNANREPHSTTKHNTNLCLKRYQAASTTLVALSDNSSTGRAAIRQVLSSAGPHLWERVREGQVFRKKPGCHRSVTYGLQQLGRTSMQIIVTAVGPDNGGLADPIVHYVTGAGANIFEIQMYDHDSEHLFAMLMRINWLRRERRYRRPPGSSESDWTSPGTVDLRLVTCHTPPSATN